MGLDADIYKGGRLDFHEAMRKIPKRKAGWTPEKYKYMGPYNPLEKQLEYDNNTAVTKWHVQPYNKVDDIAAYHDTLRPFQHCNNTFFEFYYQINEHDTLCNQYPFCCQKEEHSEQY